MEQRVFFFPFYPLSLSVQSIELIGVNNLTDSVKKINTNSAIELNMMIVVEWDGILLNNLENFNTFSCLDIGRSVQIVNRHAITSTFYTSCFLYTSTRSRHLNSLTPKFNILQRSLKIPHRNNEE